MSHDADNGGLSPWRITMEDVARAAGVSRSLVSLAYRSEPGVSEATRQRILDRGRQLGYTPNRVASRLAERSGRTLGVFLQDLHNDVFAEIYDGIRETIDAHSVHSLLAVGTLDGQRDTRSLETLQQSRVDVIIAAGLQLPDQRVRDIAGAVPIVSVAREVPGLDSVYSDNRHGARAATEHLLTLGHRRILFLSNPLSDGYAGRREGYESAMHGAGLTPHVIITSYAQSDAGDAASKALELDQPPTAIFAHNDQTALGVLRAVSARGLRAGEDVSIVGYDNSALSRIPGAELTTIDIHAHELGTRAATAALARLDAPTARSSTSSSLPTLIPRASTGSPARS